MKVISSIGVKLNGGGFGNVAYEGYLALFEKGFLKKVFCLDYAPGKIPSKMVETFKLQKYFVRYPLRAIQKFIFPKFDAFYYIDNIYDYFVSKKIIFNGEIFNGSINFSKRSLIEAKKKGLICVVDYWSSHPEKQIKLINREYNDLGKKFFFNSKKTRKQMVFGLNLADYVFIPSDFVEKSFLERGFPKEKLIKIPFGVDLKKYSSTKNKPDKKFRAIFVGQVSIRKGIHYLLQAWDELQLDNAELLVVGNLCHDAKEIVKKYTKNKTIKFIGFTPHLKKYYAMSDVFVFPSIEEGSALVTYEAMASGLPLIVTENTGSIVTAKKDGFVIPIRDVLILKEKIKYFYDHPNQVKKMSSNARKHVENFSWEKYRENYANAYKNILSKQSQ